MELHAEHRALAHWNLEATAVLLQNQFPEHHIVVVRPSRMQMLTYSCFDNFVPSNNIGVPEHTPNHGALQHMEALLSRLSGLIQKEGLLSRHGYGGVKGESAEDETQTSPSQPKVNGTSASDLYPALDKGRLSFIGFSKGCVVLNQFLYEFHYLKVSLILHCLLLMQRKETNLECICFLFCSFFIPNILSIHSSFSMFLTIMWLNFGFCDS
jgi:hypothetical protein